MEVTPTRSRNSRSKVENGSVTIKTLYDTSEGSGVEQVGDDKVDAGGDGADEEERGDDGGEAEFGDLFLPPHSMPRS